MNEADLPAWVEQATGRQVLGLDRVGYGSSRATYTVSMAEAPDLVIRRDTGDGPMAGGELTLSREAEAYRALAPTPVRIPALHAVTPDGTALLVERAAGTHELSGLDALGRDEVLTDYLDAVADLHLVDAAALDLPSYPWPSTGAAHACDDLRVWTGLLGARTRSPWPLAWYTARFLAHHVPEEVDRTVLCHGDVGPGNFMHDGKRVTALLDWEFSHLGDPMDDLAWWVFRGHDMAGNCGDLGGQLQRWSARTGLPVEPRRIDYYRIFVMFRWLVSVAATLDTGGAGMDRSVHFGLVPVLSVRLPAAMAAFTATPLGEPPATPPDVAGPDAAVLDALASDLDRVIGPAVTGPEARRRLGATTVYLAHLRALDAHGARLARDDLEDLAGVLGATAADPTDGAARLASLVADRGAERRALGYLWRHGLRQAWLWPTSAARALRPQTAVPEGISG